MSSKVFKKEVNSIGLAFGLAFGLAIDSIKQTSKHFYLKKYSPKQQKKPSKAVLIAGVNNL